MAWIRSRKKHEGGDGNVVSLSSNYMIGYSNTQKTPSPYDTDNYIVKNGNILTLKRNNADYGIWIYTPYLQRGKTYTLYFDDCSGGDGNLYCDYSTNISARPVITTRWGSVDLNSTKGVTIKPTVSGYYGLMLCSNNTNDIVINDPRLIYIPDTNHNYAERLVYVQYVGRDTRQIPTISAKREGPLYSTYLAYNSSTLKFEVLKDFKAYVTAWVYNYRTAGSTCSEGQFFHNNTCLINVRTPTVYQGDTAGDTVLVDFKAGDTFYNYTPSSNGYPQQHLKVYKVDKTPVDNYSDVTRFADESV